MSSPLSGVRTNFDDPISESVNKDPRHMNGPEDARDYLWYGQDLWMTDDVWNWANNYMPAKEAILKQCSRPGCNVREKDACEFKRCSDCHLVSQTPFTFLENMLINPNGKVSYCSPQCQKEDWKIHKPSECSVASTHEQLIDQRVHTACRQRMEFKKSTKSFGRGEAIPEQGPSILSPDYSQSMGAGVVNEAIKRTGKGKRRSTGPGEID